MSIFVRMSWESKQGSWVRQLRDYYMGELEHSFDRLKKMTKAG